MNNYIGTKITTLRKRANLTQEELAEKVGVTRQAISKWERGDGLPDLYNIKQLASVLHVSVDELVEENPQPKRSQSNNHTTSHPTSGNYLQRLLYKAKHTTNSAEAKRIKKILIISGISGIVIGVLMVLSGFFGFASGAFNSVQNFGPGNTDIFNPIPYMLLFLSGGGIASISAYILYAGLGIFIAEVTTKYLDTREACPQCGDEIDKDEKACSSCGHKIIQKSQCECGKQNQPGDKFCRDCGKALLVTT